MSMQGVPPRSALRPESFYTAIGADMPPTRGQDGSNNIDETYDNTEILSKPTHAENCGKVWLGSRGKDICRRSEGFLQSEESLHSSGSLQIYKPRVQDKQCIGHGIHCFSSIRRGRAQTTLPIQAGYVSLDNNLARCCPISRREKYFWLFRIFFRGKGTVDGRLAGLMLTLY